MLFASKRFFFSLSPFSIAWKVIWYHETLSSILFTRNANSQLAIFKFFAMSARFGKIRHTTTSTFAFFPFLERDHSQIFVTQRELMSKNISFRFSNTSSRLSSLQFFFEYFSFGRLFSTVWRGSSIVETLGYVWWRNSGFSRLFLSLTPSARFNVSLALVKKWSGKFPFYKNIKKRTKNHIQNNGKYYNRLAVNVERRKKEGYKI